MNFDEIKNTSKSRFKNIVKSRVRASALIYLNELQGQHSKSRNLIYSDIKMKDYLKPNNSPTIKEKCFIFASRTRMIDVKCNFKLGLSNLRCRKCDVEDEDQEHLLKCKELTDRGLISTNNLPSYDDLFSDNTSKIENVGRILLRKFKQLHSSNSSLTMCTANNANIVNNATNANIASAAVTIDIVTDLD